MKALTMYFVLGKDDMVTIDGLILGIRVIMKMSTASTDKVQLISILIDNTE
jgi:hypothetical protein